MHSVLFITNIPSPYRVDFFNELGKTMDVTVLFEAKSASIYNIKFNWNLELIKNFKPIFLSDGDIQEKRINWGIFKYIEPELYDSIVVTSYSYYTEMAALIYLKVKKVKYFMECDGGFIRKELFIKRWYKSFLIRGALGYFSPSKQTDKYLSYYGVDLGIMHRYPFTSLKTEDIIDVPFRKDEKASRKRELGMSEAKVVLTVGQFIHRKGFDVLLQASAGLGNDVGVYIVGGEPTTKYLTMKDELHLEHVHFAGFKQKDELKQYYAAADVFVLPTREDVWGLVINEAMAAGLPVITTNKCIAGMELINPGKNGYIIDADDVQGLTGSINNALGDNLYKMGEESISIIRNYTIDDMVSAHLSALSLKKEEHT